MSQVRAQAKGPLTDQAYLDALDICPNMILDHNGRHITRLTYDYGVYDNWPILLRCPYEELISHLEGPGYRFLSTHYDDGQDFNRRFEIVPDDFIPGVASVQAMSYVPSSALTGTGTLDGPGGAEALGHYRRQQAGYTVSLSLHPYSEKTELWMWASIRTLSGIVEDIGRFAIANRIPLCFPRSIGWKDIQDYAQIVYYEPGAAC